MHARHIVSGWLHKRQGAPPHARMSTPVTLPDVVTTGSGGVTLSRDSLGLLLALGLVMAWDVSGLDLAVSRWFGTSAGFAWTGHWLVGRVFHDAAKLIAWPLFLLLALGVWRPLPFMRGLSRGQRLWWTLTTLGCLLLISLLRRHSATSCPWELQEFGGTLAAYVPHWNFLRTDGGPGQCFPSGHASTAFAFLAGWPALRAVSPRAARVWLILTVALGLALGWVQVMRGAHFVSHSLWTGWICAAATMASYRLAPCWQRLNRAARLENAAAAR